MWVYPWETKESTQLHTLPCVHGLNNITQPHPSSHITLASVITYHGNWNWNHAVRGLVLINLTLVAEIHAYQNCAKWDCLYTQRVYTVVVHVLLDLILITICLWNLFWRYSTTEDFFPHLFEMVFLLIHFKEVLLVLHILYLDLTELVIMHGPLH